MKPFSVPAVYKISVKGTIPEEWTDVFAGMTITVNEQESVTELTGLIDDHTALQGILQSLYNLGLTLISVNYVEPENGAA